MWASSRQWARVASASRLLKLLPRKITSGTFNNHIVLSLINIVLQLSELRLSTALPPRKGGLLPNVVYTGVCRWTGYGFGLCP